MVQSLPAMQKTWVQSLGWEDPPGEGNGNPLQYSCLENSMDRGAWKATVSGLQRVGHDRVTNTLTFPVSKSFGKGTERDQQCGFHTPCEGLYKPIALARSQLCVL